MLLLGHATPPETGLKARSRKSTGIWVTNINKSYNSLSVDSGFSKIYTFGGISYIFSLKYGIDI